MVESRDMNRRKPRLAARSPCVALVRVLAGSRRLRWRFAPLTQEVVLSRPLRSASVRCELDKVTRLDVVSERAREPTERLERHLRGHVPTHPADGREADARVARKRAL